MRFDGTRAFMVDFYGTVSLAFARDGIFVCQNFDLFPQIIKKGVKSFDSQNIDPSTTQNQQTTANQTTKER
jgi:hypothetical protein